MFCGNGGSAADAQHLAAELVGKLNFKRPALAAIALTTDTSILTAIGNDYGFEHVFSRQIEALGKEGDVLVAISTSGRSRNVLNAIGAAKARGILCIGLTGSDGGAMNNICGVLYKAPFRENPVIVHNVNTQRIQERHMQLGHEFCGIIEEKMFGKTHRQEYPVPMGGVNYETE